MIVAQGREPWLGSSVHDGAICGPARPDSCFLFLEAIQFNRTIVSDYAYFILRHRKEIPAADTRLPAGTHGTCRGSWRLNAGTQIEAESSLFVVAFGTS